MTHEVNLSSSPSSFQCYEERIEAKCHKNRGEKCYEDIPDVTNIAERFACLKRSNELQDNLI